MSNVDITHGFMKNMSLVSSNWICGGRETLLHIENESIENLYVQIIKFKLDVFIT
jgi:hypothetical protein